MDDGIILQWQNRIRVLTNPLLWMNFLVGFGIPSIIAGVFFGLGEPVNGIYVSVGFFLLFLAIFVVIGTIVDLFGGFHVTFRLTDKGAWSFSGRGAKKAATVAVVGGALVGSLPTAAAGLAAKTEQTVFIPWEKIKKIEVRRKMRIILLKRSFGYKPIALYCTPQNFEVVLRTAREKSPSVMFRQ